MVDAQVDEAIKKITKLDYQRYVENRPIISDAIKTQVDAEVLKLTKLTWDAYVAGRPASFVDEEGEEYEGPESGMAPPVSSEEEEENDDDPATALLQKAAEEEDDEENDDLPEDVKKEVEKEIFGGKGEPETLEGVSIDLFGDEEDPEELELVKKIESGELHGTYYEIEEVDPERTEEMDKAKVAEGLRQKTKRAAQAKAAEEARQQRRKKRLESKEPVDFAKRKEVFTKGWAVIKTPEQLYEFWKDVEADDDDDGKLYQAVLEFTLKNRKPEFVPKAHMAVVEKWMREYLPMAEKSVPSDLLLEHSMGLQNFLLSGFETNKERGSLWAAFIALDHYNDSSPSGGLYYPNLNIVVTDVYRRMVEEEKNFVRSDDWKLFKPSLFPNVPESLTAAKLKEKIPKEAPKRFGQWSNLLLDHLGFFIHYYRAAGKIKTYFSWKEDLKKPYPHALLEDLLVAGVAVYTAHRMTLTAGKKEPELTRPELIQFLGGPVHIPWEELKEAMLPSVKEWGNWTGMVSVMNTQDILKLDE